MVSESIAPSVFEAIPRPEYPPDNPDALAKQLGEVLDSLSTQNNIKENALTHVRSVFSVDKMVQDNIANYAHLVQ